MSKIYFLSAVSSALKLNGAYVGIIGGFEKFIQAELKEKILAEVIPDGELLPVSFFICEELFKNPPPFLSIYLCEDEAVVYIHRFERAYKPIKVIAQANFNGILATLFCEGGRVYLNCEGERCNLYDLAESFEKACFSEVSIGGYNALALSGDKCLCIISERGEMVFLNSVESWKAGDMLEVRVNFETCIGHYAVCRFSYDGDKMTLTDSKTFSTRDTPIKLIPFAFFESLLTHGDFAEYLSDSIKDRAEDLPSYLGEFTDVAIPHSSFYQKHGDIDAVGLVYPLSKNLFKVKYYAVDIEGGKIDNIYEVE
ncbi:MAG: hypothetical protein ACI4MS_05270 [Candidatus Coproplasma sp.]